jgi:hypothetical protein
MVKNGMLFYLYAYEFITLSRCWASKKRTLNPARRFGKFILANNDRLLPNAM